MTTKTKNGSCTLAAMVALKSITDQGFGLIFFSSLILIKLELEKKFSFLVIKDNDKKRDIKFLRN